MDRRRVEYTSKDYTDLLKANQTDIGMSRTATSLLLKRDSKPSSIWKKLGSHLARMRAPFAL